MLSRLFLIKNIECCGNGCFMCPYSPKHCKYSSIIRDDVINSLSEEEKKITNN
jgi:hypothetical protein